MTEAEALEVISASLRRVAPEVDLSSADPDRELQEQLDIDSMDLLNLVVGVHERTGIDIPESDYEQVATLRGFVDYLVERGA